MQVHEHELVQSMTKGTWRGRTSKHRLYGPEDGGPDEQQVARGEDAAAASAAVGVAAAEGDAARQRHQASGPHDARQRIACTALARHAKAATHTVRPTVVAAPRCTPEMLATTGVKMALSRIRKAPREAVVYSNPSCKQGAPLVKPAQIRCVRCQAAVVSRPHHRACVCKEGPQAELSSCQPHIPSLRIESRTNAAEGLQAQ